MTALLSTLKILACCSAAASLGLLALLCWATREKSESNTGSPTGAGADTRRHLPIEAKNGDEPIQHQNALRPGDTCAGPGVVRLGGGEQPPPLWRSR
jgi:hypothetical protein